jgi:hypothetical protein
MNICDFRSDIFNILNRGFRYDMKIQDGISYKTILASQGYRQEKVQWHVAFYMDFLCQMWCFNEYFNGSGTGTIVEWTLGSTIFLRKKLYHKCTTLILHRQTTKAYAKRGYQSDDWNLSFNVYT